MTQLQEFLVAMSMAEGQMLNLDAHLSDLLDLYALAYNRWLRDKLQPKHSDEGCPVPREVTSAQLGRMLLQEALEQRIQRLESYL